MTKSLIILKFYKKQSEFYKKNSSLFTDIYSLMKRALLTILTIFYLGISSGATLHFHYCMGELVKLSFFDEQNKSCDFCTMSPKEIQQKSCCKDNFSEAKVDQSKETSQTVYQFKQLQEVVLNKPVTLADYLPVPIETGKAALSNAPPLTPDIPVFILNCTYRI